MLLVLPLCDCMQGSSAPINIPIMSRLPALKDDEAEDAKKPFVPPHLVDETVSCAILQSLQLLHRHTHCVLSV